MTFDDQAANSEILKWIIASIAVEKGDVKGHDFHGNQWTGGTGSEKVAAIQKRLAKAAAKLTKKTFTEYPHPTVTTLQEAGYRNFEEYQKASAQAIKDFVARGDIALSIQTPAQNLLHILDSGEIQNGYVSGKSDRPYAAKLGTKGDLRMKMENEAFGLTKQSPLSERPVYGFVDQKGLKDDPMMYGNAKIVLNPDVKERTTVTLGDSLDTSLSGWKAKFASTTAPLLASDPNPKDIFYPASSEMAVPKLLANPEQLSGSIGGYVEAQIHGGLKTSDIARVDFYSTPTPMLEMVLRDKGIPYRTHIRD